MVKNESTRESKSVNLSCSPVRKPLLFHCRVETMKQEIAQLKMEQRLSGVQWTGKEQNYKKTVQQLQGKVSPSRMFS